MTTRLLIGAPLFLTVLATPTPSRACTPPLPPPPFAIPRLGQAGVSTATTIVVVAGTRPTGLKVSVDGTETPGVGLEEIGKAPNQRFSYWRITGLDILKPMSEYEVSILDRTDFVVVTRFTTGEGYDKNQGIAPSLTAVRFWRVRYPREAVGGGACVFSEYHPFVQLEYEPAIIPDTPEQDTLYVLSIEPETGGLRQKVVFTGKDLYTGYAPVGEHPTPPAWPLELDPSRRYCAMLAAWGHGDIARLPVESLKLCGAVDQLPDTGCSVAGEPSQELLPVLLVLALLVTLRRTSGKRLVRIALVLAALAGTTGCGDDPSYCERLCVEIRPDLINNFNVPREDVDCSDPKWVGDCQHCDQLIRTEFMVQPAQVCEK